MDIETAIKILSAVPGSYRWDAIRKAQAVALAEIERLRRELCKALAIPPDTPWDEVIADAHSAGVVRDAEYRALDGCRTEVARLRARDAAASAVVQAWQAMRGGRPTTWDEATALWVQLDALARAHEEEA